MHIHLYVCVCVSVCDVHTRRTHSHAQRWEGVHLSDGDAEQVVDPVTVLQLQRDVAQDEPVHVELRRGWADSFGAA